MAQGRVVTIDGDRIIDWDSFHDVMSDAFLFPGWYGRNGNAWVDLMTYLDEDTATTGFFVEAGEIVTLEVRNGRVLHRRCPEIYDALIEMSAFVNWRRMESGGTAYLCLAFGI
jgi:RNAse (barnase) inhibitor barstar